MGLIGAVVKVGEDDGLHKFSSETESIEPSNPQFLCCGNHPPMT